MIDGNITDRQRATSSGMLDQLNHSRAAWRQWQLCRDGIYVSSTCHYAVAVMQLGVRITVKRLHALSTEYFYGE